MSLGVRNEIIKDVFSLSRNDDSANAVAKGCVQPFHDFAPNIEHWKADFPLVYFYLAILCSMEKHMVFLYVE